MAYSIFLNKGTSSAQRSANATLSQAEINDRPQPTPNSTFEQLIKLNARLQLIYEQLSSNSALVIFTGHDDHQEMVSLGKRRAEFENMIKVKSANGSATDLASQDGVDAVKWSNADDRAVVCSFASVKCAAMVA